MSTLYIGIIDIFMTSGKAECLPSLHPIHQALHPAEQDRLPGVGDCQAVRGSGGVHDRGLAQD